MRQYRNYIPIVLGLLLVCFTWISTDVTVPNERSRIYLAVSLVDGHTLSIDDPIEKFGAVSDRAERDGVSYTDKAPGSSLLAAAIYGVSRLFTDSGDWTFEALLFLMRFGLMIPITLVGFFVLRRLLSDLEFDQPIIDLTSFGWLVASPVLHYGQAFYGHQIAAVALLGAVTCLLQKNRGARHLAIAGACAGIAGLTEYQAAIPCVLIAVWVLSGPSRRRPLELLAFVGAALPFAVILFAYHDAAFGGFFEFSYHHLANPSLDARHTEGIGGVFLPSWEAIHGSLFSLHRGLLTTAPISFFALIGIKPMVDRIGRRAAIFIGIILLYFVLFIFSSNTWFAGWSYGPRLLVSVLTIAAIPLACGLERAREYTALSAAAVASFAIGLVSNLAMKLTFFEVPPSSTNPLVDVALPVLSTQTTSPSWVTAAGLSPGLSVAIAAIVAVSLLLYVVWNYVGTTRSVALVWAVLITTIFFCFIYAYGPTWDESQAQRFDGFIERLNS